MNELCHAIALIRQAVNLGTKGETWVPKRLDVLRELIDQKATPFQLLLALPQEGPVYQVPEGGLLEPAIAAVEWCMGGKLEAFQVGYFAPNARLCAHSATSRAAEYAARAVVELLSAVTDPTQRDDHLREAMQYAQRAIKLSGDTCAE